MTHNTSTKRQTANGKASADDVNQMLAAADDTAPDYSDVPASEPELAIDPEFENLLEPLSAEELAVMERNYLADPAGFPPIAVWENGGRIILDGHHRYKLAVKHGLPIVTRGYKFNTRNEALWAAWERQAGRRNMSPSQLAMYAAKFATKPTGRPELNAPMGAFNDTPPIGALTNVQAAKLTGASSRNIQRAKVVRDKAAPEVVQAVEAGNVSLRDAEAVALKPRRVQVAAVHKVKAGKAPTLKAAVNGRETNRPADRKGAREAFGRLVRELDGLGLSEDVNEELKTILQVINSPLAGTSFDVAAIEAAPRVDIEGLSAWYKRGVSYINRIVRDLKTAMEDERNSVHLADKHTRIEHHLNEAKQALHQAEPLATCSKCSGAGCKTCSQSGWWPRSVVGSRK